MVPAPTPSCSPRPCRGQEGRDHELPVASLTFSDLSRRGQGGGSPGLLAPETPPVAVWEQLHLWGQACLGDEGQSRTCSEQNFRPELMCGSFWEAPGASGPALSLVL